MQFQKLSLFIFSGLFLLLSQCDQTSKWTSAETSKKKNLSPYEKKIKNYQDSMNAVFMSGMNGVIPAKFRKTGNRLNFFPPSEKHRIKATFEKNPSLDSILVLTSTEDVRTYYRYGFLHFELNKKPFQLTLFSTKNDDDDYLFCPFKDLTNGNLTYGAGRYLNFSVSDIENPIIDFNFAYNPYCAYNPKYSCPIPPIENHLNLEILAGEQAWIVNRDK
jgi:uncharacterized protein (DUF1684 family)